MAVVCIRMPGIDEPAMSRAAPRAGMIGATPGAIERHACKAIIAYLGILRLIAGHGAMLPSGHAPQTRSGRVAWVQDEG